MPINAETAESNAPRTESLIRIYQLKYAEAAACMNVLQGVLGDSNTSGPLKMQADQRTNAIIVSGKPADQQVVESLLMKLDQAGPEERQMDETQKAEDEVSTRVYDIGDFDRIQTASLVNAILETDDPHAQSSVRSDSITNKLIVTATTAMHEHVNLVLQTMAEFQEVPETENVGSLETVRLYRLDDANSSRLGEFVQVLSKVLSRAGLVNRANVGEAPETNSLIVTTNANGHRLVEVLMRNVFQATAESKRRVSTDAMDEPHFFVAYPLDSNSLVDGMKILRKIVEEQFPRANTRMVADEQDGNLLVHGTEQVHEFVRSSLQQGSYGLKSASVESDPEADARKSIVYHVNEPTPAAARTYFTNKMEKLKAIAGADVEFAPNSGSLVITASPEGHRQAREILGGKLHATHDAEPGRPTSTQTSVTEPTVDQAQPISQAESIKATPELISFVRQTRLDEGMTYHFRVRAADAELAKSTAVFDFALNIGPNGQVWWKPGDEFQGAAAGFELLFEEVYTIGELIDRLETHVDEPAVEIELAAVHLTIC